MPFYGAQRYPRRWPGELRGVPPTAGWWSWLTGTWGAPVGAQGPTQPVAPKATLRTFTCRRVAVEGVGNLIGTLAAEEGGWLCCEADG